MKYLPLIAAALWRRPVETILTFLAVTAGFMLFASMMGLNVTYRRAVEGVPDDRLLVVSRFPGTSGGLPIGMEERLRRVPGVVAVGAWASVCGHFGAEEKFACVFTVDEGMREALPFPIDVSDWMRLMDTLDGTLLSRTAAERLNLKIGDAIPLVVAAGARGDGSNSWPFKVIGIVPDSPEWPHGYRVGNLNYFRNNRPLPLQGMIGGFRLGLSDHAKADEVARSIDHFFANSGTPTRSYSAREEAAYGQSSIADMALLTRLVAGAGLFLILYLTANVLARAVKERTAELGVLQAIGFTNLQLMGMVCAEAAIPCVLGAELGTGLAAMLTALPNSWFPKGFDIPEATVSSAVFVEAACAAVLLALVSSVLPILMLWRRRPAELLAAS
jgi:putative ABC transport system permease protein